MKAHSHEQAVFLCWRENATPRIYRLPNEETLVGRRSDCHIVINNPFVSRRHARIVNRGSGFTIVDLDSTHGTFIDGVRVAEQALEPGNRIELGRDRVPLLFTNDENATLPESGLDLGSVPEALRLSHAGEPSTLEKISWILDFQHQWEKASAPETAFDQILLSALKLSGAERAFILVRRSDGFGYATGMDAAGRKLAESEFRTSRSVVSHVERSKASVFMVEGLKQGFAEQASIIATGAKAIACLPLQGIPNDSETSSMLGILYLDSTKPMHALSGLDEKILQKLADEAGSVLERIELVSNIRQRKTLERELALAEETQKALLPTQIPFVPGWQLAGFSKPTRYVGGDFYDFIQSPNGLLIAVLGDVSGKGVSAALLSSMILGSLHARIHSGEPIETAVDALNRLVQQKALAGKFVTLFIAEFERGGSGRFISAGHTTGYIYRAASREVETLESNAVIVGAFDFAVFHPNAIHLDPGDLVISYSDGLTEAENAAGTMFEEERVLAAVRASADAGADAVVERLTLDLEGFTGDRVQTDDITILVIGRERNASAS